MGQRRGWTRTKVRAKNANIFNVPQQHSTTSLSRCFAYNRTAPTPRHPTDVYVKPGVVWHRGGREVCILGLDGAVAFFEVTPLEDYPLVEGIGGWVDGWVIC